MTKVDYIFRKLGYRKIETDAIISFVRKNNKSINFYKGTKTIDISSVFSVMITREINMLELQLIYEKCEELGWL